jgi:CheY-like chemotaxis protein
MDINMPEMDGFESSCLITKEFKEGRLVMKPFIAAITAYTSEEMHRKAINNGMEKFLTKPAQI